MSMFSTADQLYAFEAGELDHDEAVVLFQDLIDSGLVWSLQGSYGRTAAALIESGQCFIRQPTHPFTVS